MTFLNQLMLWGLLGVAIPILIHLLNRRRATVVEWGAMRFLMASMASRNRRILIEEIILMTVRCLTLGLLALAMARPFVPSRSGLTWAIVLCVLPVAAILAAVGTIMWGHRKVRWAALTAATALAVLAAMASANADWIARQTWGAGGGQKDVAIVIDGSLSMTVSSEGQMNFQRAMDEARTVVESCRPADAVSIIVAGAVPREVVPSPISDRKELAARIEALAPGGGSMHVLPALNAASATLARGKNPGKKIVLITDGQNVGWDLPSAPAAQAGKQNEDRWRWLAGGLSMLTTRPQVVLRRLPMPKALNNVAVDDLTFSRKIVGTDRPVSIDVKISNTGAAAASPTGVELLVNGLQVARQTMGELAASASETVQFTHRFDSPGPKAVSARVLWEDDIPADNTNVRMLNVVQELPVLIIEGTPSAEPLAGSAAFIELALAPRPAAASRPATTLPGEDDLRMLVAADVVNATDAATVRDLSKYRMVILANVPMLPKNLSTDLLAMVRAGGGLLVVPGDFRSASDRNPTRFYDTWTGPAGEPVLPARLARRISTPQSPARLAVKTFTHPALAVIADPAASDADGALISAYWQLEVDAKDPAVRVGGYLDSGHPFLVERKLGKGVVLMTATALDRRENNLPALKACFVPLVHELVYYLAEPQETTWNYDSGAEVAIDVPMQAGEARTLAAGDIEVQAPWGPNRLGHVQAGDKAWRLTFSGADEPGLYRFLLAGAAAKGTPAAASQPGRGAGPFVVVNDPQESRLTPLTEADLASVQKHVELTAANSTNELAALIAGNVPGQEIWRWLIACAALGLLAEIALTRWIARRRKSHSAAPVAFGPVAADVQSFREHAREMLAVKDAAAAAANVETPANKP